VVLALVLVGGATALLVASGADLAVAVSVMFFVVAASSVLGFAPGVLSAMAAFAALNYYFTAPLHTFEVDNTDDFVALVVFVSLAIAISAGVARLNQLRLRARRAEREAVLRLRFVDRLSEGVAPGEALDAVARDLVEVLDLAWCEIEFAGCTHRATSSSSESARLVFEYGPAFRLSIACSHDLGVSDRRIIEASGASLAATLERATLGAEAREQRLRAELDRSRAGFLTAVTHDLRTPLASVKAGTANLLLADSRLDEVQRRMVLQVTHDEVERLEQLVTNVLELTRIRAGAVRPQPVLIDPADLTRVSVQRLRRLADERQIDMEIDPDEPPLLVDPGMFEHVMVNLVENALRYSPLDTAIGIRVTSVPGAQQLRVIDHGPGIRQNDRERVFDEFVRLDGRAESTGTGLGLAIVRAFVEAADGRVWCEETPGGGATFVVEVPLEPKTFEDKETNG